MKPRILPLLLQIASVLIGCSILHAATVAYEFNGTVSSMNRSSNIFPDVTIGSPVSGIFTVDYDASDASASPTFGEYSSQDFSLTAMIGNNPFSSLPGAVNGVNVDLIFEDFVVFLLTPTPSANLADLIFTFYDPAGDTLLSNSLPASADDFEAFPSVDFFLRSDDFEAFGHYFFDPTITQVPEPTQTTLIILSTLAYLTHRRRVV